jgi:hypothetical protein
VPRYVRAVAAIAFSVGANLVPLPMSVAESPVGRPSTIKEAEIDNLPSGQSAGAAAGCPTDTHIVGGGVGTTGPVSQSLDYTVELSGPLDSTGSTTNTEDNERAHLWYASVHNTSGSPQDFKVFAVCSRNEIVKGGGGRIGDAIIEAELINDLPSGQSAGVAARCPEEGRVVGGGVGATGPVSPGLDYTVELSGPLDASGFTANTDDDEPAYFWYASIHNTSGAPRDFKVFALCSQDSDATIQAELINDLPSGQSAGAAPRCPGETRVVGGGVGATGPVSAGLDYTVELSGPLDASGFTANTDNNEPAYFWYASIHNTSGTPQDFKVFALCSQISTATIQKQGINDLPSTTPAGPAGAGATCAGKPVTIVGTSGPDTLSGTITADVIAGLGGNDVLKGLEAKDRICGGAGKDRIAGGAGADFLAGGPAVDRIFGGRGRDRIIGGAGKDQCNGGPAVDKVTGC